MLCLLVLDGGNSPHAALAGATGQELCFLFRCAPLLRKSLFRFEVCGVKRSLWASLVCGVRVVCDEEVSVCADTQM